MTKISIKPLSVNKCFQGRRFKTIDYKNYEKEMLIKLPKLTFSKTSNLHLEITFGYSNKLADIDNGLKPMIDILQLKYQFNDRNIYKLSVLKEIVKKGDEFVYFNINEI